MTRGDVSAAGAATSDRWLTRIAKLGAGLVLLAPGFAEPGGGTADASVAGRADERPAGLCGWLVPVGAAVVDPFRAPPHRYAAGNRGIEYGTSGGEDVVAVADGRVGFAGPVAGRSYVVVHHGRQVRSTYGPVEVIAVVRGQRVSAAQQLGSAATGFHLTARVGERYVDPQSGIDTACGRPRLVPIPPPGAEPGRRSRADGALGGG